MTLLLSAFTTVCLVTSLSVCGADSGELSHGTTELSTTESAGIKKTARAYFQRLYAGQVRKALEYASQDRESDHNLTDKYTAVQGMARIEKTFGGKLGNINIVRSRRVLIMTLSNKTIMLHQRYS